MGERRRSFRGARLEELWGATSTYSDNFEPVLRRREVSLTEATRIEDHADFRMVFDRLHLATDGGIDAVDVCRRGRARYGRGGPSRHVLGGRFTTDKATGQHQHTQRRTHHQTLEHVRHLSADYTAHCRRGSPRPIREGDCRPWEKTMIVDAIRSLRAAPAVTLFILFILTLTVSVATVTFSVVDAVVLRPLPFHESDELVSIEYLRGDRVMAQVRSMSALQFLALRDGTEVFSELAAVARGSDTVQTAGEPERVWSARVTSSLFDSLRARPLIGQTFTPAHETAGSDRVAVIGYGLWHRRFGDVQIGALLRGKPFPFGDHVRPPELRDPVIGNGI